MRIENINGTTETTCVCGSWLRHWEKFSGQSVTFCPVANCTRTDLLGAYVQRADRSDNQRYIYPLCTVHSQTPGTLEVGDYYKRVSANKKETCERHTWESHTPISRHLVMRRAASTYGHTESSPTTRQEGGEETQALRAMVESEGVLNEEVLDEWAGMKRSGTHSAWRINLGILKCAKSWLPWTWNA